MKKISPMAELRMVDTIRAARESTGKGVDPSEAVAKLAMEQNMSTEQASRICEAVNKLASIDYLSTNKDARAGEFPLADSGAVRKIMRDSLKIAREPFRFRKTINDDLPLPKMSDKQAFEKIYKPTEEEQNYLDHRYDKANALADWERMRGHMEAMKKASENVGMSIQMFGEEFIKFGRKVANLNDRQLDNMARYTVYNYGNDGVNFLTALENLTGRAMDKGVHPCMKTGSDIEDGVDRMMFLADRTKAVKIAATMKVDGEDFTVDEVTPGEAGSYDPAIVGKSKDDLAKQKALSQWKVNQQLEQVARRTGKAYLSEQGARLADTAAARLNSKGKLETAQFEDSQRGVKQDTQKAQNVTAYSNALFEQREQPTTQATRHFQNATGLANAAFDNSQVGITHDTTASKNRTANQRAHFEESVERLRENIDRDKLFVESGKVDDERRAQSAVEAARAVGELNSVGDNAVKAEKTRELEAEQKYNKAQQEQAFEETLKGRGKDLSTRLMDQYDRQEADRKWLEEERKNKKNDEKWRKINEEGDRVSKALQDMANNTLTNTKNALMFGQNLLTRADSIRQALQSEQRSGNAAARPLSNEATKYIENLRLHDVFAKTYLSDPYLHQYSPQEVAEAFNIVYEVAPELVKHGSNPHIIGALIRKYLANTNQLDPLEIRDLTSTEKDRVDTMLKQEQLEAIKRGK